MSAKLVIVSSKPSPTITHNRLADPWPTFIHFEQDMNESESGVSGSKPTILWFFFMNEIMLVSVLRCDFIKIKTILLTFFAYPIKYEKLLENCVELWLLLLCKFRYFTVTTWLRHVSYMLSWFNVFAYSLVFISFK